jgi:hypothetical protein
MIDPVADASSFLPAAIWSDCTQKQREFSAIWGKFIVRCTWPSSNLSSLYEDEILSVFQCHVSFFLCRSMIRFYLKQRKLQQLTDDFRSKFSAPQLLMKLVFVLKPWTNLFLKSLVKYSFFNLVFLLGQSGILCCCFQDVSSWLVLNKLFFNFSLRNSWSLRNGSCRRGGGGGAVKKCTH